MLPKLGSLAIDKKGLNRSRLSIPIIEYRKARSADRKVLATLRAARKLSFLSRRLFGRNLHLFRASVAHFQPSNPEQDIFRDIRGVIRNPFQMA